MLIQFYGNSDMDLQSFGSEIILHLMDQGVDGVLTDKIFFNRFLLYQPEHKVLYKSVHRDGGLSIAEINRLITSVFETSIIEITIDFCTVIGDHRDGPVYKGQELNFAHDDIPFDHHIGLCNIARAICDHIGLGEYMLFNDDNHFMLTDRTIRSYPCNFPSLSQAVREIKRFQNMVNQRDLRVTSYEVLLENDYARFSVFKEELAWLL